jgi:phosphocarrier protein HPr
MVWCILLKLVATIMLKSDIEIINKLGLHARASSKLTQTASQFSSEIWIEKNGRKVNAKSIMGVMMLAAGMGSFIRLEANGADEAEAMTALQALINDYFGEGE